MARIMPVGTDTAGIRWMAELFIAGAFSEVGGIPAYNVARLDLNTNRWSALGCGIVRTTDVLRTNSVRGLAVQPSGSPNAGLFATGGIFRAGCTSSTGFAAWYGVGQEDEVDQVQPRFPINVFGNNPVAFRHSIYLPALNN